MHIAAFVEQTKYQRYISLSALHALILECHRWLVKIPQTWTGKNMRNYIKVSTYNKNQHELYHLGRKWTVHVLLLMLTLMPVNRGNYKMYLFLHTCLWYPVSLKTEAVSDGPISIPPDYRLQRSPTWPRSYNTHKILKHCQTQNVTAANK